MPMVVIIFYTSWKILFTLDAGHILEENSLRQKIIFQYGKELQEVRSIVTKIKRST